MKTLKKVLGIFLILLPWIAFAAYAITQDTLIDFVIAIGLTLGIAGIVALGVYLLLGDD